MRRRQALSMLVGAAAAGAFWHPAPAAEPSGLLGEAAPFDPEEIAARARAMAETPYRPQPMVPDAWQKLTYSQYRDIRFDRSRAIWSDTDAPVRMDLFAPGQHFPHAVAVNVVEAGSARRIAYSPDLFSFGMLVPPLPDDASMGFSGLRLRGAFTRDDFGEEFFVMQGASYFRGIGIGQNYGLSARGLAIGTGDPTPEEFPDFIEFWVERPAPGAMATVIHALMDSDSVTGAYRFTVTPGLPTVTEVDARLFPRRSIARGGLAPLTSMFLFDATNRDRFSDFRPAVHDSEGLAMVNGRGERLWRPLANPLQVQLSAFRDENPKGFGLMQRHRSFSDYADLEAYYHNRPSLWVEPKGDWGKGHVVLVEIPADKEVYDNIVAFWRPEAPLEPGAETAFGYRLYWGEGPAGVEAGFGPARVMETRMGRDPFQPGYIVAIDFAPAPNNADANAEIEAQVATSAGSIRSAIVQHNPDTGGPRLAIQFDPEGAPLVELRAGLVRHGKQMTETWLYRWTG